MRNVGLVNKMPTIHIILEGNLVHIFNKISVDILCNT